MSEETTPNRQAEGNEERILGAADFRREANLLALAEEEADNDNNDGDSGAAAERQQDITDYQNTAETLGLMGKSHDHQEGQDDVSSSSHRYDEPAVVRAYLVPEQPANSPNFPPVLTGDLADKSKALTIHDGLLREIKTLDTVEACVDFYDSIYFQEIIRLLRMSQDDYIGTSQEQSPDQAREIWARLWALALSRDEDWAWSLNYCRRTALKLLYKVCDLSVDPKDPLKLDLDSVQDFKKRRVNQILKHSLVMDRANALYNMKNEETGQRGLGWYSKQEKDSYQNLRDPPLPLNPDGATTNKRLKRLQQCGLYTDNTTWLDEWLKIAVPPGQI